MSAKLVERDESADAETWLIHTSPTPRQGWSALAVAAILLLGFGAIAPFADTPLLPTLEGFIPAVEATIFVTYVAHWIVLARDAKPQEARCPRRFRDDLFQRNSDPTTLPARAAERMQCNIKPIERGTQIMAIDVTDRARRAPETVPAVFLGAGEHRYRIVEKWAKLPDGWDLPDVAAVGVDSKDRIYLFNRGEHPMVVLDRDGNFIRSWGEGLFRRAHGLHIDAHDQLYCTDDGDHTVRKCTPEGKVLLTIGIPDKPAPYMSGEPFHRCTHTALSPKGDIYVSDGYGNACVHKYTPDGKRIMTWGEPGTDPGQFNIVHNIVTDEDGWVYVADRENHRVQVFDGNGKYETEWNHLHRPCALCCCGGRKPNFIIGELGPGMPVNLNVPNLGPRLTIVDAQGKRIARLGGENGPGLDTGKFLAPHGLALDSRGDIYVGEVGVTTWKTSFPDTPRPKIVRCLQKLERVS